MGLLDLNGSYESREVCKDLTGSTRTFLVPKEPVWNCYYPSGSQRPKRILKDQSWFAGTPLDPLS